MITYYYPLIIIYYRVFFFFFFFCFLFVFPPDRTCAFDSYGLSYNYIFSDLMRTSQRMNMMKWKKQRYRLQVAKIVGVPILV